MKERYYSIHDIIKIVLRDYRSFIAQKLSLFEKDYEYFLKLRKEDKADLIIEIGKFSPLKDCEIIENQIYRVKENYLFGNLSYKIANYRFELSNFENEDEAILLRIWPNLFANLVIHEQIIDFVVSFILNSRGYSVIHASCVSKNNQAILFTGSGRSGKTSFSLFSMREGFDFMGDDRVILHKGTVFAFPESIGLHLYNFRYIADFMSKRDRLKLLLKDVVGRLSKGYLGAAFHKPAKSLFPRRIKETSALKTIICLQPSKNFQISKLNKDEIIRKIYVDQMFEIRRFKRHIFQYSTIFPNNKLERYLYEYIGKLKVNIPEYIEAYEVRFESGKYDQVTEWLKEEIFVKWG